METGWNDEEIDLGEIEDKAEKNKEAEIDDFFDSLTGGTGKQK